MAEVRALRRGFLGATAALFAGGLALFLFAPDPESAAPAVEAGARAVRTQRVRAEPVQARLEVSGVLEARRSVQLFAETRGPVVEVGAEALDAVEEGQLLLRVDSLQADAALERARAAVVRAQSELALARSNLERRRELRERGVASDSDLEDRENAERVAAAVLRQGHAELTQIRDELSKKTILAPFSGVLARFDVEVGEYVSDGKELGELLDLETARVLIGVSDRDVVALRAGQPAGLTVEAYPSEVFQGTVLRVGAAAEAASKKFPIEVEVENPGQRLLPGMVATVSLEPGEPRPRTVIPREATLEEFGLRFVWRIVDEGGVLRAERRRVEVRPLPFQPEQLEVLSGLAEGDEIATSAIRQLRPGDTISRRGDPSG